MRGGYLRLSKYMGLNFSDLYQTILGIWTCSLAGFIFVKCKMFNPNDMPFLQYVIDACFIPALYFYMIANSKLTWENWKACFPVMVIQFFIHLVIFVFSFIGKSTSFAEKYFKAITSYGFSQWDVFAYQILDELGANQYQLIAVFYGILDEFIYFPVLKILVFYMRPGSMDMKLNHDKGKSSDNDQEQEEISDITDPEANPDTVKIEVEGSSESKSSSSEKVVDEDEEKLTLDKDGNPKDNLNIKNSDSSSELSASDEAPASLKFTLLWAWVNSRTICIIAALIYSATVKFKMPDYISELSKSLRAPSFPCLLFLLGVQVANTKLTVWTPGILLSIFERYVFCPLFMAGLCRAFKIDSLAAKGMIMMAMSPPSNRSHIAMGKSESMEKPKAIYAWTMLMWLPMAFIWGAIIIKTNIV